jgi:GTPase KRas protein
MLVGNSLGHENREVTEEEGASLARQLGCEFIEASPKTGENVERAFASLIRTLRQANRQLAVEPSPPPGRPTKRNMRKWMKFL